MVVVYPVPRDPTGLLANISRLYIRLPDPPAPTGRIMSSLAGAGGLAAKGGLAGAGGGLAA